MDDDDKFAVAVLTVVTAALFFAVESDASDGARDRCFDRADKFVEAVVKRYGKDLHLA